MKSKYLILIWALFLTGFSLTAQSYSEFRYFSFSGGMTHGFLNIQELGKTNKLLFIGGSKRQLINKSNKQLYYASGINLGLFYNLDFKNGNMGIVTGLQYQLTPYKTKYFTESNNYEITEKNLIRTISLPVYFKYGKEFYIRMRYLFFGVQANYYLAGKATYIYLDETNEFNLAKDMLANFSPEFFIGFNYNVLNLKVGYSPFQIIKDSPIYIDNLSEINGHSKHFISLQTNINIPLNSWTHRNPPSYIRIMMWFKRAFF
jgi:hypothetical protein